MRAKPFRISNCEVNSNGHCVGRGVYENLRSPGVRILVHFAQCLVVFNRPRSVPYPTLGFSRARLLCLGRDWKARTIAGAQAGNQGRT
jgi:hypothetical protein